MSINRLKHQTFAALIFSWTYSLADGYQFEAAYTGEFLSNVSGGISTGSVYLDNLNMTLDVDVSEAWGFGSGQLFVHGLYNNGTTFSDEFVGDFQVVSNIEAGHAFRLYEFWYELSNQSWSLRTGLYDLNSEFDTNGVSDLFLNSSHGIGAEIGQTGDNGPSIFPVTSLAARADASLDNVTVRVAVLDGVPGDPDNPSRTAIELGGDDGVLSIAEVDVNFGARSRFWSGIWRYSGEFDRLYSSGTSNRNEGWYAGVETRTELGGRTVAGFMRYGQANDQLNPVSNYFGAGFVIAAPVASRPDDLLGFALASVGAGRPYRNSLEQFDPNIKHRETSWEVSYRAKINDRLIVQPDIQLIQNPSALSIVDNAVILGLRFEIVYY